MASKKYAKTYTLEEIFNEVVYVTALVTPDSQRDIEARKVSFKTSKDGHELIVFEGVDNFGQPAFASFRITR